MDINGNSIADIEEADLTALVLAEASETRRLDFKRDLPGRNRKDRLEFLADVSSFANTAGGTVLFGIDETDGRATAVVGVDTQSLEDETLRLEQLLRDGLEPRLAGVQVRRIELGEGRACLAVGVGRSWTLPHRVTLEGHDKFYARSTKGKYPMDVEELRRHFLLGQTVADRIYAFRSHRVDEIEAGRTPRSLTAGPIVALHLVPFTFGDPGEAIDVARVIADPRRLSPIYAAGWDHRPNFDGVLSWSRDDEVARAGSYLQVFRSGATESVTSELTDERNGLVSIPSRVFERAVIEATGNHRDLLLALGVQPPIAVMLSLLGVTGVRMGVPAELLVRRSGPIDRDRLLCEPVLMLSDRDDLVTVLRPALDAVWNACGWLQSPYYRENGTHVLAEGD